MTMIMNMMKKNALMALVVTLLGVTMISGVASAHTPLFSCWDNGDNTISCEGGYSDGSSAAPAGTAIIVKDAGGSVISSGKLDKTGQLTFNKPSGDYSVTFDGGPGHSVVVNGKDIK